MPHRESPCIREGEKAIHHKHRSTRAHDPKLKDERFLDDGYVSILSDAQTYRSSPLSLLIPQLLKHFLQGRCKFASALTFARILCLLLKNNGPTSELPPLLTHNFVFEDQIRRCLCFKVYQSDGEVDGSNMAVKRLAQAGPRPIADEGSLNQEEGLASSDI